MLPLRPVPPLFKSPKLKAYAFAFAVLGLVIAGGALECSGRRLTEHERHGEELYQRMCAVCHGTAGEGYKADNAPALSHPDFLSSATDAFLWRAIADGRSGTVMSAWSHTRAGPLSAADIGAVIAYLRTWERPPKVKLDESPLGGAADRGATAYAEACAACHGARGVGGPNIHIGNRELLDTASNGFLRHAIRNGREGTPMPAFGGRLPSRAIDDIIAHLRAVATPPAPQVRKQPEKAPRPPPIPLGPVPLNSRGPEPVGFQVHPVGTAVDTVKQQLDRGARMALLDARTPSDYIHEHIAGAVSVPFYDPSPYLDALPKDAWLICYCACPSAESGILAQKLMAAGFKKVTILKEGLRVWKSKNYGLRSGEKP